MIVDIFQYYCVICQFFSLSYLEKFYDFLIEVTKYRKPKNFVSDFHNFNVNFTSLYVTIIFEWPFLWKK